MNAQEYLEKFQSGEKNLCSEGRGEQPESFPLVNRKSVEKYVSDTMIEADTLSPNHDG